MEPFDFGDLGFERVAFGFGGVVLWRVDHRIQHLLLNAIPDSLQPGAAVTLGRLEQKVLVHPQPRKLDRVLDPVGNARVAHLPAQRTHDVHRREDVLDLQGVALLRHFGRLFLEPLLDVRQHLDGVAARKLEHRRHDPAVRQQAHRLRSGRWSVVVPPSVVVEAEVVQALGPADRKACRNLCAVFAHPAHDRPGVLGGLLILLGPRARVRHLVALAVAQLPVVLVGGDQRIHVGAQLGRVVVVRHVELVHVERQVLADARAPAHVVVEQREDRRAAKRPVDVCALRLCERRARRAARHAPAAHRPVNVDDNSARRLHRRTARKARRNAVAVQQRQRTAVPLHDVLHGAVVGASQRRHVGVAQHVVKRVHVVGVAAAHPLGQPVDVRNPAARRRQRRAEHRVCKPGESLVRRLRRAHERQVPVIEPRLPRANVDRVVVCRKRVRAAAGASVDFGQLWLSPELLLDHARQDGAADADAQSAHHRIGAAQRVEHFAGLAPPDAPPPADLILLHFLWAGRAPRRRQPARVLRRFDFGRLLGWVANPRHGAVQVRELLAVRCALAEKLRLVANVQRPLLDAAHGVSAGVALPPVVIRLPQQQGGLLDGARVARDGLAVQKDVRLRMRLPRRRSRALVHHVVDAAHGVRVPPVDGLLVALGKVLLLADALHGHGFRRRVVGIFVLGVVRAVHGRAPPDPLDVRERVVEHHVRVGGVARKERPRHRDFEPLLCAARLGRRPHRPRGFGLLARSRRDARGGLRAASGLLEQRRRRRLARRRRRRRRRRAAAAGAGAWLLTCSSLLE